MEVLPFGNKIILKQKNAAKNIDIAKTNSSVTVSTLINIGLNKNWGDLRPRNFNQLSMYPMASQQLHPIQIN